MKRIALIGLGFALACAKGDPAKTGSPAPNPPTVVDAGVAAPAPAPPDDYADTLHGVIVPDPWRWLEDTTSAKTKAWMVSQQQYADSILVRLVGRDSLQRVVERSYASTPTLDQVMQTSRGLVLTRWLGDAPSLLTVDTGSTTERMLLHADTLAGRARGASLRAFTPSWDGSRIVLGTTERGDANAALIVIDATTGRTLPDRIPDLFTTTSGTRYEVTWLPDGSGFFYPRLWPGSANGPDADKLARGRQFLHRLGTPQSADTPVFGFDVSPAVTMEMIDVPTRVYTAPGSQWLVASIFRSKANGTEWFFAPLTLPLTRAPEWKPLASVRGKVSLPQLRGDTVYALSTGTADRGQIVRRVLRADGDGTWETVLPEQAGVVTSFSVQRDGVYATVRERGAISLLLIAATSATAQAVALPVTGTVRLSRGQPTWSGVTVSIDSWAVPPRWLRVLPNGTSTEPLLADDGSAAAATAGTRSDRLEARSKDGTLVPVSFVYGDRAMRDGKLDGSAPLLIEAYGGFGVSTDPFYYPLVHTWVALGGVYGYAHVRGGGELGSAWHHAATRENKQRSVDDMIGAIEALIAGKYTSAGRVTITGTSFGANIPGIAMLQRPELFGAVLYEVGQPDEIRGSQLDPTAARNIAEIGDVDTPEGIRSLVSSSPYHQVTGRVKLPAIIVHSASEDYNFGTQMLPAKFVARLQNANSGTRPVVWLRTDGGHRSLPSLSPKWAAVAMSFTLWQSGDPQFQPRK